MNLRSDTDTLPTSASEATELARLRHEHEQMKALVDVTNAVLSTLDLDALLNQIAAALRAHFPFDYLALDLFHSDAGQVHSRALHYLPSGSCQRLENQYPQDAQPARSQINQRQAVFARQGEFQTLVFQHERLAPLRDPRFQVLFILPLCCDTHLLGTLVLAHGQRADLLAGQETLMQQIAARIALSIDNALAYQEITRLKDRLASENRALAEEISHYENFDEIIGQSEVMANVLEQVRMVADTDSSVLILGETGTGKELIARAIHNLSPRRKHRLVTMNCAAIPAGLMESDLFGHEKGTFTGATAQRVGRFELADRGTLFLDEIGDIPLELQPKLLRVLQEREVERLGGHKIIPVDVRVIAATSCDLPQMIADKRYRSDLFYRLNVFPIHVPPLRERPEDIPLLARFFTRKLARRINRQIESVAEETIQRLMHHPWPGNVRELQNVIERAVILSRGPELSLPQSDLCYESPVQVAPRAAAPATATPVSSQPRQPASEREEIIRVLKETNGIVAGPKGAAARLGLKRTTLLSRMQRLGISVRSIEEENN